MTSLWWGLLTRVLFFEKMIALGDAIVRFDALRLFATLINHG